MPRKARAGEATTRRRIVKLLKTEGPLDSAALAARLKVTPMAVRQHLYALQEEKLVAAQERPVPLGRPAKHWHLTREADRLFPDAYAELNAALMTSVQDAFGPDAMSRLLDARLRRQRADYAARIPPSAPLAKKGPDPGAGAGRGRLHGRGQARRQRLCLHREPLPDLRCRHRVPGVLRDRARPVPFGTGAGGRRWNGRSTFCRAIEGVRTELRQTDKIRGTEAL
jgi:DNA-binding transcriptional ArsR family regulator